MTEPNQRRKAWRTALGWWFIGFITPIAVGIAVRTCLTLLGKPVVEWSWFAHVFRIVQFFQFLASWTIPFLVLAGIVYLQIRDTGKAGAALYGAFIGGLAFSIVAFCYLWQNLEGLMMVSGFAPWAVPLATSVAMLLGSGVGWAARRFRRPH